MADPVSCPRCGGQGEPVGWTWWGGAIGGRLFSHTRCRGCRYEYHGKTGAPGTNSIIIYNVVGLVVAAVVVALWLAFLYGVRP